MKLQYSKLEKLQYEKPTWFERMGGVKIDKRTTGGKATINKIEGDIKSTLPDWIDCPKEWRGLRVKDITLFRTINEN